MFQSLVQQEIILSLPPNTNDFFGFEGGLEETIAEILYSPSFSCT